jgi:hypothetical protein
MNRFSWLATLGLIGAFTSDSFGQDAPPAAPADPTAQSRKFQELDFQIRNAEKVNEVLRENERLHERLREMLKSNEELAARAAAAEQAQKDLTASVTRLLTELEQMKTRAEDLEGRLTDFSRIELQGLLVSEEGSSTALLKVAGQPRFVQAGMEVTLSAGADPKVSQTILVKEIRVDGVLVELAGDDRNPDSPAPTAFIQ